MSVKKQKRAAVRAAREEQQGKKVMKGLIGALILLIVLCLIAYSLLGNAF